MKFKFPIEISAYMSDHLQLHKICNGKLANSQYELKVAQFYHIGSKFEYKANPKIKFPNNLILISCHGSFGMT